MKWNQIDCKYYNYSGGRGYIPEWQRAEKCGCQACLQSKRDAENSTEVTANHIDGVFCKDWTHCTRCSRIKHLVRVLKHFSGQKCSKKCPVCQWPKGTQEAAEKMLISTIANIYGHMLSRARVIGWRVQKAIEERQKEGANE